MGNMAKPGVGEQIDQLRDWFGQRCEVIAVLPADKPLPPDVANADLCVIFGGDGTLLSVGRSLAGTDMPMLGVNMGKLGFLAEFTVEHLQKHFDEILSGKVKPVERMRLEVCVSSCDKPNFCSPATNDVAISAGEPFRMIDLQVSQGQTQISRYLGDGLVVSTPTGSTGYNMSAGGPIMEPTLDAMAITPIAPHTLSVRPIVVQPELTVRITAMRVNPGTNMMIDGQISCGLCDGDTVEVSRAKKPMLLIPHPGKSFFETLTKKLYWGRSPHHDL